MKDIFVSQFLKEVKEVENSLSENEIKELEGKARDLLNALSLKNFAIHDPGTYAMIFIVFPGPVYFSTFFHIKEALKMLLSFIEKEDFYLDLPENELSDMVNYMMLIKEKIQDSLQIFSRFFDQEKSEQERILYARKNLRWMYSEKGIEAQIGGLFESIDEEISYVASLLQDLKSDEVFRLYFGTERDLMETVVNRMMAEKSAKKALLKMKSQIQQNFDESHLHLHIFRENGFRLFDYLMKNHLSSGLGWQSDVSFFYRMMKKRDELIHGSQKLFKEFLAKEYDLPEPMGKFKLWNGINTEKRNQIYSSAMRSIGLK
jgi:hypothetical protein